MSEEKNLPAADDEDNPLSDRVLGDGEEVKYCIWNGGAPGYSGSTRIYAYEDQFYVYDDGQLHGPFDSKDAAEDAYPVFYPVNEEDEGDSAIVEIWDQEYGVTYQKLSLVPLGQYDARRGSLWVIDDKTVTEPWVGGQQLGELPNYDTKDARLVRITQAEIDEAVERHREESGT